MSVSPGSIFAPLLIGTFLNMGLLGVTSVQAIYYFQTYKRDRWWFKLLVFYLMLAEVCNSIFDIALVYEPLITHYGSPIPSAPKFLPADAMTTALISTPVQLFMAWRIKKITKSSFLSIVITIAALSSLVGGAWLSISSITDNPFSRGPKSLVEPPVILWLASSGATDVLITLTIVISLLRKRKTQNVAMDPYVNRVIRLSVQAGVLTVLAVLLDMIVFLTTKGAPYFFIWDLNISKLYTNSLLASLNSRPAQSTQVVQNALFENHSESTELKTFTTITTSSMLDSSINSPRAIKGPENMQKRKYSDPHSAFMQHGPRSFHTNVDKDLTSESIRLGLDFPAPRDRASDVSSRIGEDSDNGQFYHHIDKARVRSESSDSPPEAVEDFVSRYDPTLVADLESGRGQNMGREHGYF
ncbi:hypothetical protein GYMLUDRAFT_253110 [Collybiopsis luxurians FD-317 M1]|uniref:Unplaced genomic scaffold GYMLUscaffold_164, whole genome shotgun sequence n=1 Tax=Collybiopsis luxurians FD-317 M1 TaxID=944289 RepID=A0A0D0B823_9AGAR|nr:hypothetical protein GYMLUDRAFT_253110 [Collybiopsis luxurians FD-317 M1]